MSRPNSWLDELDAARCVASSAVPKGALRHLAAWEGAGIVRRQKSGAGSLWVVLPGKEQSFAKLAARLRQSLQQDVSTRAQAALVLGDSKRVASDYSLINWKRPNGLSFEDCAPVGLDGLSVFSGLRVALVENWDTYIHWSADIAEKLGVGAVDAVIAARGREILNKRVLSRLWQASPSLVVCAFDFDAAGLSFYADAKTAALGEVRVAWPPMIDEIFSRCRGVALPRFDLAKNAKILGLSLLDADAKRWSDLIATYGIGVEQQAFYGD